MILDCNDVAYCVGNWRERAGLDLGMGLPDVDGCIRRLVQAGLVENDLHHMQRGVRILVNRIG